MTFTKKDLIYSIITGVTAGAIARAILAFLGVTEIYGVPLTILVIIVPIAWIAGVNLGYFLGRWMGFFNQFGKYAAVGFTNAMVDFGVLDLLIGVTGIAVGLHYALFKTISFSVAVVHSYFWNKNWVFQSTHTDETAREFTTFLVVNIIVAAINVGTAYSIVNYVQPLFGLNPNSWATFGAVVGSAVSLLFNFIGFRLVVFKKK